MKLNSGIQDVIEANISPHAREGLALKEAWERLAPEKALRHTDNVVVSKKRARSIAVFVDDPASAASLSMSKEYYRQMFEHELGRPVEEIFFVVSKATGVRKHFSKEQAERPWYLDDSQPKPLDAGERAYAEMSVAGVEDAELKETLLKAFVSDLEWKKGRN